MQPGDNLEVLVPRALDVAVRVGLALLLAILCFQIVEPFIAPIIWGAIIAIGTYPGYRKVEERLNGAG